MGTVSMTRQMEGGAQEWGLWCWWIFKHREEFVQMSSTCFSSHRDDPVCRNVCRDKKEISLRLSSMQCLTSQPDQRNTEERTFNFAQADLQELEVVVSLRELLQLSCFLLQLGNFFFQLPYMCFSLDPFFFWVFFTGIHTVPHFLYFTQSVLNVLLKFRPSPFKFNLWENTKR